MLLDLRTGQKSNLQQKPQQEYGAGNLNTARFVLGAEMWVSDVLAVVAGIVLYQFVLRPWFKSWLESLDV